MLVPAAWRENGMMIRWLMFAAVLLLSVGAAGLSAVAAEIEAFVGRYEGTAIDGEADGLTRRDISVTIAKQGDGFTVSWTTAVPSDGSFARKSYTIEFERSNRPNVFGSAMRKDMFGNRVPLNPLKGDPYVWATLYGDTLTVYSLLIDESGGYDLQQYDRTLVDGGLELEFSRMRQGQEVRRFSGVLKRVDG